MVYRSLQNYLSYQGQKYIKPEKAGESITFMLELRQLAQSARKEFEQITQALSKKVGPFYPERVSQWMNQAQICRPHFWSYFRSPEDTQDDVGLAIRMYGNREEFGISVEVSFVERKKSESSLLQQKQVLDIPIEAPIYYWVQEGKNFYHMEGSENNRLTLIEKVETGQVRKVLVKYDISLVEEMSLDSLTDQLTDGFERLMPYYEVTKKVKSE